MSDSGASGHGLRIIRPTLHRGEKDRESRWACQAATHHQVDSQRKSRQRVAFSDSRRRSPAARIERRDMVDAIMWWRLRSGPVIIAAGVGRGVGSIFVCSIYCSQESFQQPTAVEGIHLRQHEGGNVNISWIRENGADTALRIPHTSSHHDGTVDIRSPLHLACWLGSKVLA